MLVNVVQNDLLERSLKILEELKEASSIPLAESLKPVYNTKELSKLLKVSSRSIQSWRDNGHISYFQLNKTILYSAENITQFLKKHNKPAFK